MMKRGSSAGLGAGKYALVVFCLGFWVFFVILGTTVQVPTGIQTNFTLAGEYKPYAQKVDFLEFFNDASMLGKIGILFKLMTFQIPGVPTPFGIMIDFIILLTGLAIYGLIRGD